MAVINHWNDPVLKGGKLKVKFPSTAKSLSLMHSNAHWK